jgi:hypothetical protein
MKKAFTRLLLALGVALLAGCSVFADTESADPASSRAVRSGLTGAPPGWSSLSMARPRADHTATLLPNGKVLVAGGLLENGFTAASEVYDPGSGRWSDAGPMVAPRAAHTATLLPDGQVLVSGGFTDYSVTTGSAELYTDARDPCSAAANPGQADSDGDGRLDTCDVCPNNLDPQAQAGACGPKVTLCNRPKYTRELTMNVCGYVTSGTPGAGVTAYTFSVKGGAPVSVWPTPEDQSAGFVFTEVALVDGPNDVRLVATDSAGGVTMKRMTVVVDRVAPVITLVSPTADETLRSFRPPPMRRSAPSLSTSRRASTTSRRRG